ncbi:MAG: glycosidase, partial [Spirochaetia bacterium]|nr:glycosidase [Spirochaetia bacterium]
RFGLVIPNVIFPTGNVEQNGTVFLYYGCCDTSISLAQASLKTLLGYVKRFPRQHAA